MPKFRLLCPLQFKGNSFRFRANLADGSAIKDGSRAGTRIETEDGQKRSSDLSQATLRGRRLWDRCKGAQKF
jgi:hypothetical protein